MLHDFSEMPRPSAMSICALPGEKHGILQPLWMIKNPVHVVGMQVKSGNGLLIPVPAPHVIPVKAGIQTPANDPWIPASARSMNGHSDGIIFKAIAIPPGWAMRLLESVGSYGEMLERNLGSQSALKLERVLNRI
jgi:hypothetical protein